SERQRRRRERDRRCRGCSSAASTTAVTARRAGGHCQSGQYCDCEHEKRRSNPPETGHRSPPHSWAERPAHPFRQVAMGRSRHMYQHGKSVSQSMTKHRSYPSRGRDPGPDPNVVGTPACRRMSTIQNRGGRAITQVRAICLAHVSETLWGWCCGALSRGPTVKVNGSVRLCVSKRQALQKLRIGLAAIVPSWTRTAC